METKELDQENKTPRTMQNTRQTRKRKFKPPKKSVKRGRKIVKNVLDETLNNNIIGNLSNENILNTKTHKNENSVKAESMNKTFQNEIYDDKQGKEVNIKNKEIFFKETESVPLHVKKCLDTFFSEESQEVQDDSRGSSKSSGEYVNIPSRKTFYQLENEMGSYNGDQDLIKSLSNETHIPSEDHENLIGIRLSSQFNTSTHFNPKKPAKHLVKEKNSPDFKNEILNATSKGNVNNKINLENECLFPKSMFFTTSNKEIGTNDDIERSKNIITDLLHFNPKRETVVTDTPLTSTESNITLENRENSILQTLAINEESQNTCSDIKNIFQMQNNKNIKNKCEDNYLNKNSRLKANEIEIKLTSDEKETHVKTQNTFPLETISETCQVQEFSSSSLSTLNSHITLGKKEKTLTLLHMNALDYENEFKRQINELKEKETDSKCLEENIESSINNFIVLDKHMQDKQVIQADKTMSKYKLESNEYFDGCKQMLIERKKDLIGGNYKDTNEINYVDENKEAKLMSDQCVIKSIQEGSVQIEIKTSNDKDMNIDEIKNCRNECTSFEATSENGTKQITDTNSRFNLDQNAKSNFKEAKTDKQDLENDNFQGIDANFLMKEQDCFKRESFSSYNFSTEDSSIFIAQKDESIKENLEMSLSDHDECLDMDDDFDFTASQLNMLERDETNQMKVLNPAKNASQQTEYCDRTHFGFDSITVEVMEQLCYIRESIDSIKELLQTPLKKEN